MATKNRSDLKSYFVKNAIPTEGNFADLIDSQLNQAQDGVFKLDGQPLSVVAAPGDQRRTLRLYGDYPAANPDWLISLKPAQDPADATTCRPGFGVADGAGNTRLFVEAGTGRVGVGTNTPQFQLDVVGPVRANGVRGRNDLVLNDYRTPNPASNVCLHSPAGDRDAWIYRDSSDPSTNWGIYHRQIDTAIAGLPGNAIGFVGNGNKLQAYVGLGDGSAFFAGNAGVMGSLLVNGGPVTAPAGVIVEGAVGHIDRDGALYRNTDGQVYLTVDDNLYIRDGGAASWAAHFDTNGGHLEVRGVMQAAAWRGVAADWNAIGADGTIMTDGNSVKAMMIVGSNQGQGKNRWVRLWDYLTIHGGLTVEGGSRFSGDRHLFTDAEAKGRLRVGAAWGVPGLYSEDNQGIVVGCNNGQTVMLGQPGGFVQITNGEISADGAWLKVKGAGDEQAYVGGDAAGNDVQIGSTKAGVTLVSAWNWTSGWMDVAGRNWIGHSDVRAKEDVQSVTGALDKVRRLRCVSFQWKGEAASGTAPRNLGLVAQEVEQVVPEAVARVRGESLGIAYNAITALLVGAINEQQKQIDELQAASRAAPGPAKTRR